MKKLLILCLSAFFMIHCISTTVNADSTITIDCTDSGLKVDDKSHEAQLEPGDLISYDLIWSNKSNFEQRLYIQCLADNPEGLLLDVLNLNVYVDDVLYKTIPLTEITDASELGVFKSNQNKKITMEFTLDKEATNKYTMQKETIRLIISTEARDYDGPVKTGVKFPMVPIFIVGGLWVLFFYMKGAMKREKIN